MERPTRSQREREKSSEVRLAVGSVAFKWSVASEAIKLRTHFIPETNMRDNSNYLS